MKFVLSLVLAAYVATAVESAFLKDTMDSMKKLTSGDSYASPSYSAPSYSAPSYSAPSYSAPVYQEAQPIYVIKPESREYVTEVHEVKHYPVRKYKTKHVYSNGYGSSGESYESNEYGTYNSGGNRIYRRDVGELLAPAQKPSYPPK